MPPQPSITNLNSLVHGLSSADKELFNRIYHIAIVDAGMRVPEAMRPWAAQRFGSVEAVESQRVTRVVNRITGEGTLFNGLRAQRPSSGSRTSERPLIANEERGDALANPLELTPEDTFGRVENRHGVTAANVARYDALHSLVIFSQRDPLAFTQESLAGHLALAQEWIVQAHGHDSDARYPYILWNCLWRAGGSLGHGHFQVAMARGMHYAKIERLRRDTEVYHRQHGASYFDDLFQVHLALGCGHRMKEARVLAHLTPLREKEVLVLASSLEDSVESIYQALAAYRDRLEVTSFNMGVLLPSVAPVQESWEGFPVVVRMVDRGELASRTSDVGGMELFAESVAASDPFAVADALRSEGGV